MDLLRVSIDGNGQVAGAINLWLVLLLLGIVIVVALFVPWIRHLLLHQEFEINEIELGIGSGKVKLRPHDEDLQIAYRLWVELMTRKLGLPFDEDHDVIVEVYNSWYEFFRITRELIKGVPIDKVRREESTQLLVRISIDVLNKAIRPHLTKWQARYRHWYQLELQKPANVDVSPQDIQKRFPGYRDLVSELKATNSRLIAYAKMLADILELNPIARNNRRPG